MAVRPWRMWLWSLMLVIAGTGLAPAWSRAESTVDEDATSEDVEAARTEFSSLFNVDQLMNRAAHNIAMRYNLNAKQRADTENMLRREVTKFLNEHPDIWPLVRDLARMQQAGQDVEGRVGQRLAAKAMPLMQDIENAILEANQRWRPILTEDQKRMHDYDLQDMARQFAQMDDRFRLMAEGKPVEPEIFPKPNKTDQQPRTPDKPPASYEPPPPPPVQGELPTEHMWDQYVHKFIRDYKLNDPQSEAALSILKECKDRAEDYRKSKRAEYAQVEAGLRDAQKNDQSPEVSTGKLRNWKQIQVTLNRPIVDLFQELQDRLDTIPSEQQRDHARSLGVEVRRAPRKPRTAGVKNPATPDSDAKSPAAADDENTNPGASQKTSDSAAKPAGKTASKEPAKEAVAADDKTANDKTADDKTADDTDAEDGPQDAAPPE